MMERAELQYKQTEDQLGNKGCDFASWLVSQFTQSIQWRFRIGFITTGFPLVCESEDPRGPRASRL